MSQPTFTQVRDAIASALTDETDTRTVTTRLGQINPPCLAVMPGQPAATYSVSMDGQVDFGIKVIAIASPADSQGGQDILDGFIATDTPESVWAALQAMGNLGGLVGYVIVTGVSTYGLMNINGVEYLAATFEVEVGT